MKKLKTEKPIINKTKIPENLYGDLLTLFH